MKIRFNRESLLKQFSSVMTVVPTRSPQPVLKSVRLSGTETGVTLEATDLEIGIHTTLTGAVVEDPGAVLVPAQSFRQILSESGAAELTIIDTGKGLEVVADRAKFKLPSADVNSYPALRSHVGGVHHELRSGALATLIRQTSFATDPTSSRYALAGVAFDLGEANYLTAVATDGRRLSMSKLPATATGKIEPNRQPIVPDRALKVIERVLGDPENMVRISATENEVFVTGDSFRLSARLVEGRFPKWREVIPVRQAHRINVNREQFAAIVRQASIFTSAESRGIDFTVSGVGDLTARAASSDAGEGSAAMPFASELNPDIEVKFSLDGRYVLDYLGVCRADVIVLDFLDDNSNSMVRFDDGEWVYLVMPMAKD